MGQQDLFTAARAEVTPSPRMLRERFGARELVPQPQAVQYVTGPELRARGWTDAAIRKFLGRPDATLEKKTRSGCTYVAYQYEAVRVAKVEATADFRAWVLQHNIRRQAARKGRDRALALLQAWTPAVPRMSLERLRTLAIENFNARVMERAIRRQEYVGPGASLDSGPDFLDRISVNYLRHRATRYDEQLKRVAWLGKDGRGAAIILKKRALEAIREVYPELVNECARQVSKG